ncbi:antibiotic biosynthesis monooxygenase family protein [Nocardioides sp. W7]|uniref:antibiotic biosynthesis monooxygenase family protein n=1 Tax=Nocardioides sp. W7 TaxID=2931390 RepID=UPI001FD600FC|nr:antibiotic biosynthesis monooxygenase family protein [Nocardioides sp. W7]
MIRSILRLRPRPDGAPQVLDFYERREILARALSEGGCAGAELHLRLPDRDEVVVSALWKSVADYESWTKSTGRATEVGDLEELLAPESLPLESGDLYEVVACLPEEDA